MIRYMKMMLSLLALTMPMFTSGFVAPKGFTTPKAFTYVGDIAPLGYFDPLGLSANCDEGTLKYLREAELQHGRVAMLSFLAMVGVDALFPDDVAVNHLSSMSLLEQSPYWFGVASFEVARMLKGWKDPTEAVFSLEDTYQPGNLFEVPDSEYDEESLNKELSNGRLAMIGCLGYMAQELVQHTNIISLK